MPGGDVVRAAGELTVLSIDGEPDDRVSLGKSFVLYEADSTYVTATTHMDESQVHVQFGVTAGGATGDYPWSVELHSPHWSQKLTAGTYSMPSTTGGIPPIRGNGFGFGTYGCYSMTGSFIIHEISMDWPDVHSLSASFEQTCAETPNDTLYGEVRLALVDDERSGEHPIGRTAENEAYGWKSRDMM